MRKLRLAQRNTEIFPTDHTGAQKSVKHYLQLGHTLLPQLPRSMATDHPPCLAVKAITTVVSIDHWTTEYVPVPVDDILRSPPRVCCPSPLQLVHHWKIRTQRRHQSSRLISQSREVGFIRKQCHRNRVSKKITFIYTTELICQIRFGGKEFDSCSWQKW